MRIAYGILVLSLSGLGGAIAYTGQDAPLAEQQFKNIQSFKGQKASDVIPAMEFMSASLKVDCDYCHVADRASDELNPKKTTREMIAMQRDINNRNFNGRNQVTCSTCHRGQVRPMSLPPVTGIEVRSRRSQTVVVADVLAAYGKAAGTSSDAGVSGLKLEGISTTGTEKSKVEATYFADKFTYVTHGTKGDQKMGFNGSLAWFGSEKGIQKVPLQYAVQYVNAKFIYTGPSSLPQLSNPTAGTAKIDGKDQLVVMGTAADKSRVSLFFDKTTGLLSRVMYSYPTILGSMAQINDFSNYKKVNGVEVPMKIASHSTQMDTTYEFKSAKFDSKTDVSGFEPPK